MAHTAAEAMRVATTTTATLLPALVAAVIISVGQAQQTRLRGTTTTAATTRYSGALQVRKSTQQMGASRYSAPAHGFLIARQDTPISPCP
mmetsp:Transcript_34141/g.102950  ORF Transcript_34141/g.102950 Transcript_34141/m.102950 type:complete len:90 (+) Transcript_34141:259-528(+)